MRSGIYGEQRYSRYPCVDKKKKGLKGSLSNAYWQRCFSYQDYYQYQYLDQESKGDIVDTWDHLGSVSSLALYRSANFFLGGWFCICVLLKLLRPLFSRWLTLLLCNSNCFGISAQADPFSVPVNIFFWNKFSFSFIWFFSFSLMIFFLI